MNAPPGDKGPKIPFCELNSLEVIEVGDGAARCATTVGPWLEGTPELGVPAGVAALADMVLMYASSTRTAPGYMPVTLSLRIDLWAPPPACGCRLVGRSRVEPTNGDALLSRGEITVGDTVVATVSCRSMHVPVGNRSLRTGGVEVGEITRHTSPDGADEQRPTDSILALPSARLAGLEVVAMHEGAIEMRANPSDDMERTDRVLHGGAVPLLGSLCASFLMQSAAPDATVVQRLDQTTDFLRPTPLGADLRIRSEIVNRSRRVIQTRTEILAPNGRPTARVLETSLVEPTV